MSKLLPDEVQRQLRGLEACIDTLTAMMKDATAGYKAQKAKSKEELDHLAVAKQQQQLAELLTAALRLYLVARGLDPDQHEMKRDVDRLTIYQRKIRLADPALHGREPRAAGVGLDVAATNRFITHAIPDLSAEQRERLKQASKRAQEQDDGLKQQQRQQQDSEAGAAAEAAAEVAEVAAAGGGRPSKRPRQAGAAAGVGAAGKQRPQDAGQRLVASILEEALGPVKQQKE